MESDHQLKIETIEAELGAMKKDRDQAQIDFNEQVNALNSDYQKLKNDDEIKLMEI